MALLQTRQSRRTPGAAGAGGRGTGRASGTSNWRRGTGGRELVWHRAGWLADSEQSAALGRRVAAGWLDRLLPEVRRILMRRRLITAIEQVAGPPNVPAKQPGGKAADAGRRRRRERSRAQRHACLRASFAPAAEDGVREGEPVFHWRGSS